MIIFKLFSFPYGIYWTALGFLVLLMATPAGGAPKDLPKVTILCYHKFSPGTPHDLYTVSIKEFQGQLDYLQKNNYKVISLDQALELLTGKAPFTAGQKWMVITVDDGHRSFYDLAYPLMKSYGYTATLYISTDRIGTNKNCLRWQELARLQKEGYIIGSHSLDHPRFFAKHTDAQSPVYRAWLQKELGQSKEVLEKKLGIKIKHFAHPYGLYIQPVLEVIKEKGYESAATVNGGNNTGGEDPFRLKRTMVLSHHTLHDFASILEKNPLPLKELYPADGAVVSGKNLTLSARIDYPSPPGKVRLFFGPHEQQGFNFQEGVLQYKPPQGLPAGAYIIEIHVEYPQEAPWVGSWLFYVQEPPGKSIIKKTTNRETKNIPLK
jgi:peptidoglycan/xylan/chitin deacetylase (PgdA/CDA1 family)